MKRKPLSMKKLYSQALFLAEMLLDDYSDWLHKKGYLDTDYYAEEPTAVKAFLKEYFDEKTQ